MKEDTANTSNTDQSQDSANKPIVLSPARYSLMGQVLADKYIVIDAIGEGDLTIVYMGQSMEDRQTVAIKTLKYDNPELKELFTNQCQTFQRLKHPNIVEIYEVLEGANGLPILIMEYIEGVSLVQLLESLKKIDDENTLVSIVSGVCESLEYVHSKSLFHGGLTPNQILISENEVSDDFTVKVSDFGTASLTVKFNPKNKDTSTSYISPELKKGEYAAVNTDVFSIGAITYLMVSGRNPLASNKLSSLVAGKSGDGPNFTPVTHLALDLPFLTELNRLLEQALENDPDWRMPSISQFKKELNDWHRKAISEDFDEVEDFDEGLESSYEMDEVFEQEPASDNVTTFDGKENYKEPEAKKRAGINEAVTATQQSQVVNFEASPSFYTDLFKKPEESEAQPVQDIPPVVPPSKGEPTEGKDHPEDSAKIGLKEKLVTEEVVFNASKVTRPRKRRRRRGTRSTQQNVRTTIRNLVSLRENQINQEETIAMQFAGKFSAKGPRLSPKQTAIRLAVACLCTALITGLILGNLDNLQVMFNQGASFMGSIITPGQVEEETIVENAKPNTKLEHKAKLSIEKVKSVALSLKNPLTSSSRTRLNLNKLESSTPLGSDYYKNWRHSAYSNKSDKNSRLGNRRRIDYKKFDESWLR